VSEKASRCAYCNSEAVDAALARAEAAEARVRELECQLNIAAGMVSTMSGWSDKHPQEALDFIKRAAASAGGVQEDKP
jgi:hypothetical protein